MDASLLANEVIDTLLKRREKRVLCKLNIEKAYDQINWNCILKVLQKMGFGAKWVNWIRRCITTTSFSVMINGSPEGFFNNTRGLRQGDPLSSYLFVIGMEVFSILVDRGGNSCRWVVFVSCQYTNRVNIRQPKPDTNNKRVNIR